MLYDSGKSNKAVDTCPSTIQFIPEYYKTQERCDKAVYTCPFVCDSAPDQYMTQKMYEKAVDAFLPTLKLCPIGLLQI